MRKSADWARERFAAARAARLATVSAAGRPHIVPIVFALVGDRLITAVDAKPKSTNVLRRLGNVAANPSVSVLVDHYADDWTQLWWARADGAARVGEAGAVEGFAALVARYAQYREQPPPGPVIEIRVETWSGWSAE